MTTSKKIFRMTTLIPMLIAIGLMITVPMTVSAAPPNKIPSEALLPELQAVVPDGIQVVHKQQSDTLRFTNGIANTGLGHWQMAPTFPANPDDDVIATQQLLDADGNIVHEQVVSTFEFHDEHNHWHIADVTEFSVHQGSPDGPVVGDSNKVTFCVEDVYNMIGNTNTADRVFWDCTVSLQGVQAGWADQYHQSTPGNQVDITGITPGIYYLVHNVNPDGNFIEGDYTNNKAWTELLVFEKNNGQIDVVETGITSCSLLDPTDPYTPALCGEQTANRG
ncbi:lysyl oxidase family protein [Nitrosopumilus sp. S4]